MKFEGKKCSLFDLVEDLDSSACIAKLLAIAQLPAPERSALESPELEPPRTRGSELVCTTTLPVGAYAGQEVATMFHGTSSRHAQLIVLGQRFQPSKGGMLGIGVYVTRDQQKAEGYVSNFAPALHL